MHKLLLLVAVTLLLGRVISMPPVVVADEKPAGLPVAPTDVPGVSPMVAPSSKPPQSSTFMVQIKPTRSTHR